MFVKLSTPESASGYQVPPLPDSRLDVNMVQAARSYPRTEIQQPEVALIKLFNCVRLRKWSLAFDLQPVHMRHFAGGSVSSYNLNRRGDLTHRLSDVMVWSLLRGRVNNGSSLDTQLNLLTLSS